MFEKLCFLQSMSYHLPCLQNLKLISGNQNALKCFAILKNYYFKHLQSHHWIHQSFLTMKKSSLDAHLRTSDASFLQPEEPVAVPPPPGLSMHPTLTRCLLLPPQDLV